MKRSANVRISLFVSIVLGALFLLGSTSFSGFEKSLRGKITLNKDEYNSTKVDNLEPGLYLIVGAFSVQRNAVMFTNYLVKSGKDTARFAFYPPKDLYYVYLGKYKNRKKALDDLDLIRSETGFDEAWLFNAKPYSVHSEPETKIISMAEDLTEEVKEEPKDEEIEEAAPVEHKEGKEAVITDNPETSQILNEEKEGEPKEKETEISEQNKQEEVKQDQEVSLEKSAIQDFEAKKKINVVVNSGKAETEGGFRIYFNTFREKDFKEIKGNIEIVNPDNLKSFKITASHQKETIPKSFNRSGNVEFICEIFGYKKVQHDLNLNQPFNEKTFAFLSEDEMDSNRLIIDFQLVRYTKGDLVTMYNVYFYKDAAIMRPESKYEVGQLLEMLNENPEYEIMIHGHTNGNNSGPIITMADESKAFFSKSGPTKQGYGSAKKLSQARADIIKRYLIEQGIDAKRMTAKGWGGKKGIYKKFDPLAYKNVRVEIEILAD